MVHSAASRRQENTGYAYADTPLGRVLLVGRVDALTGLYFDGHPHTPLLGSATGSDDAWLREPGGQSDEDVDGRSRPPRLNARARRHAAWFAEARRQLDEYFDGRRATFDLRLDPAGTAFQRAVWGALLDIRCGETTTYRTLAMKLGRPHASRAVGAANGANPISIVIPCHRVVGASGALTGYGWGIDKKAWLLGHERNLKHLKPPGR